MVSRLRRRSGPPRQVTSCLGAVLWPHRPQARRDATPGGDRTIPLDTDIGDLIVQAGAAHRTILGGARGHAWAMAFGMAPTVAAPSAGAPRRLPAPAWRCRAGRCRRGCWPPGRSAPSRRRRTRSSPRRAAPKGRGAEGHRGRARPGDRGHGPKRGHPLLVPAAAVAGRPRPCASPRINDQPVPCEGYIVSKIWLGRR